MDSGDKQLVPAPAALHPAPPKKRVAITRARALSSRPAKGILVPVIAESRRLIAEARRLTALARAITAERRGKGS